MFKLVKEGYNKNLINSYGNMFLIGNGHLGYRGTLEEYRKEQMVGLNVVGFYDRFQKKWRESINMPNPFYVRINNHTIFDSFTDHKVILDLKHAIFERKTSFDDITISSKRVILQQIDNSLIMEYKIKALKECEITVNVGLDSDVFENNGPHFKCKTLSLGEVISFEGITNENKKAFIGVKYNYSKPSSSTQYHEDSIDGYTLTYKLNKDEIITIHAYAMIKERKYNYMKAYMDVLDFSRKSFRNLLLEHKKIFEKKWDISDVIVKGNKKAQFATRYSIYHLLILSNHNYATSIPARGVSGSVYKGAIFWDSEIFMLPFYTITDPQTAKMLIQYRINTLPGALKKAKEYNYLGAFYAWESQEKGQEGCSKYNVTDPKTNKPIRTYFNEKQIHISGDIIYGFIKYMDQTGDKSLLSENGLKMMIEVSKFYYSYSTFINNRFEILDVIGPDEYHERVNNNAFTNYLAFYVVNKTIEYMESNENLLSKDDFIWIDKFKNYVNLLYLPMPNEEGIIEQFDGYFALEDVDVPTVRGRLKYKNEYWGCKNGVATPTRVIKQADVITLLALFPNLFDKKIKKANYDFYNKYTEHGSSLSASMYSLVGSLIGYKNEAYDMFIKSASIDLGTDQKMYAGGIYIGGTHPASNGGSYLSLIYGFACLHYYDNDYHFSSNLPKQIKEIKFKVLNKNKIEAITVNKKSVRKEII